jgi:hypothetical protein
MAEGIGSPLTGARHPLTDGPLANTQRLSNPALRPALLLEAPGLEPSGFFPVGRGTVHTWKCTRKLLWV